MMMKWCWDVGIEIMYSISISLPEIHAHQTLWSYRLNIFVYDAFMRKMTFCQNVCHTFSVFWENIIFRQQCPFDEPLLSPHKRLVHICATCFQWNLTAINTLDYRYISIVPHCRTNLQYLIAPNWPRCVGWNLGTARIVLFMHMFQVKYPLVI